MQAQNSRCRIVVTSLLALALTILGRQFETNKIEFWVNVSRAVVALRYMLFWLCFAALPTGQYWAKHGVTKRFAQSGGIFLNTPTARKKK